MAALIRPRMYGSTDSTSFRTRIWPSASSGTSLSASSKFSGVGQPVGREASRHSRGAAVVAGESVMGDLLVWFWGMLPLCATAADCVCMP